jgi:predicted negative regulator of RcsB-dependent stress response
MDDLKDEREQLEALRDWFNRNGTALLGGLAVGLSSLFGWRYWEEHTRIAAESASITFNRMKNSFAANETGEARSAATQLLGDSPDSGYGAFAALMLARLAVDAGAPAEARDHLEWLLEHHPDDPLAVIARARLAAVYLELKQPQQALAQVGPEVDLPNTAAVAELRGDVMLAAGKPEEARKYFHKAAELDPAQLSDESSALALKLDALGGPLTPEGGKVNETTRLGDTIKALVQAKAQQEAAAAASGTAPADTAAAPTPDAAPDAAPVEAPADAAPAATAPTP